MTVKFDDKGHGGILALTVGNKTIVRDNAASPLFGTLMESKTYDGFSDYVGDAKFIEGKYERVSYEAKQDGGVITAKSDGKLTFPGNDVIHAQFIWIIHDTSIEMSVQLRAEGEFNGRFIRELGIQLPTALNERKRIVEGGDQGWQFDSRRIYQFHLDTTGHLMPEPEHNYWNLFMVEQDSPLHFRAWRSESHSTPPMVIQHGHQAAGWISEYDEQGGLLAGYRNFDKRAPKALYIDATQGGAARILLQASAWKALPPKSALASALLFDEAHRVDWIPFEGQFHTVKPDAMLAKAWGVEKLSSTPPAAPKIFDIDLWNAQAASDENAPMDIGGIPLPRGTLAQPEAVRLRKNDQSVPLQTRTLAYWPDGSIKWLLLMFPLRPPPSAAVEKKGELLPFQVTLRNGTENFELEYGKDVTHGPEAHATIASEHDGTIEINTGTLRVSLTTGERWLKQVWLKDKPLLREQALPLGFADFLRVHETYPTNTTHPVGDVDPGALNIDSMVLEESGPLRAMVRLEGYTKSKEPERVILRIEAYAGHSGLRIFHTIEFLHKDTRKVFMRSMGLRLPLALDPASTRVTYGSETGAKEIPKSARCGVLESSHLNYRAWRQDAKTAFPEKLDEAHRCRGWLNMSDANFGCEVVLRNMWQEYPKELVADSQSGELTAYLWPESVSLMDVRRYSNFPHPSQGESADPHNWWVEKDYYQNSDRGPFIGISKTHEMLLWFHAANTSAEQFDAVAADFQSPPLVYAAPEYYAKTGITIPYSLPDPKKLPQIERNIDNVTDFFFFHQKMWGWYGMFDYGDFPHRYMNGYGAVAKPETLANLLKLPPAERSKNALKNDEKAGKFESAGDYCLIRDWCFDNGRWGWSNTEGLPGWWLQMSYLRTGRRDLYFAAEAMARNTRDVDMRHDGRYFGCGTRHGVQHWSDGDHEERQVVAIEWRLYHLLSGDMRCRDFLTQLTERVFTKGRCEGSADHSGRLYGLVTQWELTGDKKLGEMVKNYAHCFIVPDGIDIAPKVEFPAGKLFDTKPGSINGGDMFFHNFGAMHALWEYQVMTGDTELRDAIIRMGARYVADAGKSGWTASYRKPVAFAAINAPDPAPFREAMATKWPNSWECPMLFRNVTNDRKHWTGETSGMVFDVSFTFFCMADIFHCLPAFDKEPEIPPARQAKMDKIEAEGLPHSFTGGSWQSEYDKPEFQDYLKIQPWPKELGERKW